jgi:ParB/RepB/Spo0J family partition protein
MIKEKTIKVSSINNRRLFIDYVPTDMLMPNEYNPNSHSTKSFDLLIRSICLYGFTQPIVVDRKTNQIIDGENRWRVACVLDIPEVPVCFIDLTDEQRKIATIIHNEARGKHSQIQVDNIAEELRLKGINLNEELLNKQENEL